VKALLVDDSESVRQLLRQVLTERGCDVVEAENGYEALEGLTPEAPPHIAFVDRQMPIMDGLDFIKAVRADARFNAMRIIMFSGPLSPEQEEELPPSAIDCFLPKPLGRDSVTKAINRLSLL
jgi:two-component system, chemotaxis family, chemotaxis protein CheY